MKTRLPALIMALSFIPTVASAWFSLNLFSPSTHLRLTTGSRALLDPAQYPDVCVMFGEDLDGWASNVDNDLAAHGNGNTPTGTPGDLWQAYALDAYAALRFADGQGSAYYYIGLMTHLVEDRGVPAHSAEIAHGGLGDQDNLEQAANGHYEPIPFAVVPVDNPWDNHLVHTLYTRSAIDTPEWRAYWILGGLMQEYTGSYGGEGGTDIYPTSYSSGNSQEQAIIRQQEGAAVGHTAGMLAAMSRLLPPLVRTALKVPNPVIDPVSGNQITFKVLENRTRNVIVSLLVEGTGQPIVDADGNVWDARAVTLNTDTELPWGRSFSLTWRGSVSGTAPAGGPQTLRLRVWDSEDPRNEAPERDNDGNGVLDTRAAVVMPCAGPGGETCTPTPTRTPTVTATPTVTPTGTWYTATPTLTATHTPGPDAAGGLTVYGNAFDPGAGEAARICFRADGAGPFTLSIYNVAGELLTVLWDGPAGAGSRCVDWDGRNRGGKVVSSGVYLAVLSSPSGERSRKLAVLKK